MGSVDVGIGHDDDLVVAQPGHIDVVLVVAAADPHTEGRDDDLDFLVLKDLVESGLLHVEDLAAQGQDGLVAPVAALLRGAARGVALDEVQLACGGVLLLAVGKLTGQCRNLEGTLAASELLGAPGCLAGPGGVERLADDRPRDGRMLLEERRQLVVDDTLNEPLDLAVAELGLRLPLELGLADLDADDGGEALAHVLALDRVLPVFQEAVLHGVVVDRARQRRAEPAHVGAALGRVDAVGVGKDVLAVGIVVLNGHLGNAVLLLALDVDGFLVQDPLVLVNELHEGDDAALVIELRLLIASLVDEGDADPLVQESELPHAVGENVEAELHFLEDLRVRHERDRCSPAAGLAHLFQGRLRHAALVGLPVDLALAANLQFEVARKGVDHGDADTVQAAGDLVAIAVELAAGVQFRHGHLGGRYPFRPVNVHGNSSAVVVYLDAVVDSDPDGDDVAKAGDCLVHAVVHHLVDKMVQSVTSRAPDVHGGPLADRLETVQYLDAVCAVDFSHGK